MEQLPHRKYPENAHVRFLRLHKPKSGRFIFFFIPEKVRGSTTHAILLGGC
jgi:hypothetical protein